MRWGVAAIALAVAVACQSDPFFVCNDDGDCGGAAGGLCEPVGACSFPDSECASGRRFGEASAPSIAGECTNEDVGTTDGTSTASSSTTVPPTTSGTDDSETADTSGSTGASACPPDWWDCAWSRRLRIGFTELPDPALTDFAALVLLAPPRIEYEHLQADAEDLRFVSGGGEPLPFEIETWDPAGVSIAWVSVDQIGPGADEFFLYYGNPVAENAQDAATLWAAPYAAVWHLSEGTPDSSAYANHATPAGTLETTQGQIGSGQEPLTSSSRLDVMPSKSLADIFVGGGTITAWIRPFDWGGGDFGRIVHHSSGSAGFIFNVGATGRLRFAHAAASGLLTWSTANDVIALDRWSHVAVTHDPGTGALPSLFVDGLEVALEDPVAARPELAPTDAELPFTLGNRPENDRRFEGKLDEIRIEQTVRSPEWIRLQHLSGRDALLVFGPSEQRGGPP